MKILKSIILFCLLVYINCTCESSTSDDSNPESFIYEDKTASKKTCPKRQFSSKEVEKNYYKCCYIESECTVLGIKTIHKGCDALTKDEYKDIETYVQVAKGLACSKYKIECSGNILKKLLYSTFILLFIL